MRSDYCPVANEPCQCMCLGDCRLRKGVRYAAMETELTECKAAYESQFKELHAVKAELKAIKEAEPVAIGIEQAQDAGLFDAPFELVGWVAPRPDVVDWKSYEPEVGTPLYTLKGKS